MFSLPTIQFYCICEDNVNFDLILVNEYFVLDRRLEKNSYIYIYILPS